MTSESEKKVVVIGGGPAGLTAAYQLARHNLAPVVLEQNDKVGGIACTENYKGYHFDMGGHRFFTKAEDVKRLWDEILGDDFLRRPRLSRIFYRGRFFYYPLKIINALFGLGIGQAILIILSYVKWQIFPYKQEITFEHWVTNRFGKRLFEIFFKTYTEKVWGIPCSELRAEWAAQRIKDLSLKSALISVFVKPRDAITSLIEEFDYPRLGPGMLWNRVKERIERDGGAVHLNSPVTKIHRTGSRIDYVVASGNGDGETIVRGTDFISSMPVSEFIKKLEPVPAPVLDAANKLAYRDFLIVCLIVNKPNLFPDNWIYIHSPNVRVGRIQNFKNWSQDMVPDVTKTSLGLEYFCTEGDDIWSTPDHELVEQARKELEQIGLAHSSDVVDGCVFRVPKAYPVYDSSYRDCLRVIQEFLGGLENFQTIGRNGLHRYNNQDHSMITGMLAVRNVVFGEKNDLWAVNSDLRYQEEIHSDEKEPEDKKFADTITRVFPKLDPVSFGLSAGITGSLGIFIATLFMLINGNETLSSYAGLLSQFLPGFSVSWRGVLLGMLDMFIFGFAFGSMAAYCRNLIVYASARVIHQDIELQLLQRLFDFD
ncbi:MAG: NAD(P)/FAD-dependent oxidoreductase [Chloroflexi bacterium]|nr:NAD(P)/FAD-dependent oxidoreductase [Chloroflexota bacterium]